MKYHSSIPNIRRYSKIIQKIRAAGISEEDIEFILDYQTKDALHVADLAEKAKAHEREKTAKHLAQN